MVCFGKRFFDKFVKISNIDLAVDIIFSVAPLLNTHAPLKVYIPMSISSRNSSPFLDSLTHSDMNSICVSNQDLYSIELNSSVGALL